MEYFGTRGVANCTPSPFQACDGVQLQINIKDMSTGVLLDQVQSYSHPSLLKEKCLIV